MAKANSLFIAHWRVIGSKNQAHLWGKNKGIKKARHQFYGYWFRRHGNVKVHRIVCEAWHGLAPSPKSVVIHIDENGLNNKPENLKWGTQKENLNMPKFIEYCKGRVGSLSPTIKHKLKNQHLTLDTCETLCLP